MLILFDETGNQTLASSTNGNIAAVGTITIDEMGCITAFDDVAVRLFGYESVEVVGLNVSMLDARALPFPT